VGVFGDEPTVREEKRNHTRAKKTAILEGEGEEGEGPMKTICVSMGGGVDETLSGEVRGKWLTSLEENVS